jgi:hypothetical protein
VEQQLDDFPLRQRLPFGDEAALERALGDALAVDPRAIVGELDHDGS